MITGKKAFQTWAQNNNTFYNDKRKFRQKWLVKKSKFVWRKKTHPEHKYSVTFVSKVGTIKKISDQNSKSIQFKIQTRILG